MASDVQFRYLEDVQKHHDFNANLLKSHNIDACKVYQKTHATAVLETVNVEDRMCSLCQKAFSSAHILRSHIKSTHIGEMSHKCDVCGKSYAEAAGLKIHKRSHEQGEKYECETCGKEYISLGRLNEHKKSHRLATQHTDSTCVTCKKIFLHRRNYLQHIKVCGQTAPVRHQCHLCPRNYAHKRDLTTHLKQKHK